MKPSTEKDTDAIRKVLADLHQLFPVRAMHLIASMRVANKKSKKFPKWREDQIAKIGLMLTQSAMELERAYIEERMTTLAWSARNLLEISIWIDFCNLSEERGKRFHDDAMRDLYGLSQAVQRIVEVKAGAKDQGLEDKMSEFSQFAQSIGVQDIDDDFKPVLDAAREVGRLDGFRGLNKLLSKFAHPTAWAIHIADTEQVDEGYRAMILRDGVELAMNSLLFVGPGSPSARRMGRGRSVWRKIAVRIGSAYCVSLQGLCSLLFPAIKLCLLAFRTFRLFTFSLCRFRLLGRFRRFGRLGFCGRRCLGLAGDIWIHRIVVISHRFVCRLLDLFVVNRLANNVENLPIVSFLEKPSDRKNKIRVGWRSQI